MRNVCMWVNSAGEVKDEGREWEVMGRMGLTGWK